MPTHVNTVLFPVLIYRCLCFMCVCAALQIRSVAERSKNRGSMLMKLLASLRRREGATLAVKTAQVGHMMCFVPVLSDWLSTTSSCFFCVWPSCFVLRDA
jgi:hypothetical protein